MRKSCYTPVHFVHSVHFVHPVNVFPRTGIQGHLRGRGGRGMDEMDEMDGEWVN